MVGTGASNPPGLAVRAVVALDHVPAAVPKVAYAIEVRTEVAWRTGDRCPAAEVIAPRVAGRPAQILRSRRWWWRRRCCRWGCRYPGGGWGGSGSGSWGRSLRRNRRGRRQMCGRRRLVAIRPASSQEQGRDNNDPLHLPLSRTRAFAWVLSGKLLPVDRA